MNHRDKMLFVLGLLGSVPLALIPGVGVAGGVSAVDLERIHVLGER